FFPASPTEWRAARCWASIAILADPAKRGGARPRCHHAILSSSARRATRRGMAGALGRAYAPTNLFFCPTRRLVALVIASAARNLLSDLVLHGLCVRFCAFTYAAEVLLSESWSP